MPRKKQKIKKIETQCYMVDVTDWSVYYAFIGLKRTSRYQPRKHGEDTTLTIYGDLTYPKYKTLEKARIYITAEPVMDNHWREDPKGERSSVVGYLQILSDKITLWMAVEIPSRMLNFIQVALVADKIKYIIAYGERLKWGRGTISNVNFSTKEEED